MKRVTFSLDEATIDRLSELKEEYGIPFSEAVRRAVWMYYQENVIVGGDDEQ